MTTDLLIAILTHEYSLVIYGTALWELQQQFSKPIPIKARFKHLGSSMIWGGLLVAFDDEIADLLFEHTGVDLYNDLGSAENTIEWYFYVIMGFTIDIIRNKITKP